MTMQNAEAYERLGRKDVFFCSAKQAERLVKQGCEVLFALPREAGSEAQAAFQQTQSKFAADSSKPIRLTKKEHKIALAFA